MTLHRRARKLLCGALIVVLASGCAAPDPTPQTVGAQSWSSVLAQAKGQTVSLWMYSGDTQGNAYVDKVLTPAVAAHGVTLRRVPVADTSDALARVLAERQAGVNGGTVDLVWVNGANFATGRQAGAWLCGWSAGLPNTSLTNPADPLLGNDFGVPVDGCESPWHKAQFSLVYDAAKIADPPVTLAGVLGWARAHPGRFTYPAPPDFTGSVFLRQVLTSVTGGGAAVPRSFSQAAYDHVAPGLFSTLHDLAPSLWRGGATYPQTGEALNKLYADGQVDMTMTYGPATLTDLVANGTYPATTRVLRLDEGTFGNASFLALPASSGSRAGAMVVANTALSPEQQAAKANPSTWGQFPVLDEHLLTPAQRTPFDSLPVSPVVPGYDVLARNAQAELAPGWVTALDAGWRAQVLTG